VVLPLPLEPVGRLALEGISLGGGLGAWLSFEVLHVPASLRDSYAAAPWYRTTAHVALIVGGLSWYF
jgi:hypothetical protein